jgi:hypothetical protein
MIDCLSPRGDGSCLDGTGEKSMAHSRDFLVALQIFFFFTTVLYPAIVNL